MTKKIRILVVDDSAVVRRLLHEAIAQDSRLEMVAAAENGREGVDLFEQFRPDAVIMDVAMPEMDGIEAVAAIRALGSHTPVIMFSALTTIGGEATLDALRHGANEVVIKPNRVGHVGQALDYIRQQLFPKIVALVDARQELTPQRTSPPAKTSNDVRGVPDVKGAGRIDIVAIGVSTGGPNALAELLAHLPADLPVPIVIVQHMPPLFIHILAERLDRESELRVREVTESGLQAGAGEVWIAPGGRHLEVARQRTDIVLQLHDGPAENSCRPAVDVLFRSVAANFGSHALALILTGMGHDGLAGCRAIKEKKGKVIAQDQATCTVWGMPRAVTEAGLTDRILPLDQIAPEVVRLVKLGRAPLPQVCAT